MRILKLILRYLLVIFFVGSGLMHFIRPAFYLNIMPPYLPWHSLLVYLSGVFEVVFGAMVLVPRLRSLAGWGLILLLIAVFPANIHMAANPELYPRISPVALWIRLPLQGVMIAWAYWCTRPDRLFKS